MANLLLEEIALLNILTEGKEARERIPIVARALVSRPEKYAFPIGLDVEEVPFPIPPPNKPEQDVDGS